jgi:FAD/FMN-containing dehydrogenase
MNSPPALQEDNDALLADIVARCGPAAVVPAAETARRALNLRGDTFAALPLLRPANTAEVAFMVRFANEAGRSLIPVGGSTGLVEALRPAIGREWYLSLERMRRIERIDPDSRIAVVEAGVVVQSLQEAAAERDLLFAMDLGSRGSATIGGLISTNAGGERVLRFGMMRQQVLGLEVVTAQGEVLDLMAEVVKNNAGYDLKQLFIGSEGTLGIVTRAVIRLRPAFAGHHCAMLGLDLAHVPSALARLEKGLGGTLSACELMWPEFLDIMTEGPSAPHRRPLQTRSEAYLLIEAEGGDPESDQERFTQVLEDMLEQEVIRDATVARSLSEREALWAIRNDIPALSRSLTSAAGFDVSVPISAMAEYVSELRATLQRKWPQSRLVVFGHVADNNLHVVVSIGPNTPAQKKLIADDVYAGIVARKGSISAEHGIGLQKREALHSRLPEPVMSLMRQLKGLLDPKGILNPGKVV